MNKFKNLKVGDVLENSSSKITVLDVFTQSCVVEYNNSSSSSSLYSFKELEMGSYELVKPEWRADVEGQRVEDKIKWAKEILKLYENY